MLGPHIWGGEPWPTYLSNDPKLERFRDFATPNFTAPTIIPTVKRPMKTTKEKQDADCYWTAPLAAVKKPKI